MERRPSNRLQESSPFVTCRHLGSGKPFWGVGTWGPPGQGPGVSGGIPADSLWREVWGQQALGVGWRVGCTQEAAGPLVLAASTQSCFCLSSDHPPPQVTPTGHTHHREKRTGAGGGQGKREAGSPCRPTETQGNICRWRCLADRRLQESQGAIEAPRRRGPCAHSTGWGTVENPREGCSDPVPSLQSSRRQSDPLKRPAQVP